MASIDPKTQFWDLETLSQDRDLAAALGDVMIAWAHAEATMSALLARASGMNVNMAMMGYYRIPTFDSRRKFLQSVIAEWKAKDFDKPAIEKELEALSRLSKTRNDWVHGVWCRNYDSSQTVLFDLRAPEGPGRRKIVKAADVNNHVEAVNARSKELARLIRRGELWGES